MTTKYQHSQYWKIHKADDGLTKHYKCNVCKALYASEHRRNAVVELRGNDNAEHATGMLIRLCEVHFQELKDTGEIEK